MKIYVAGKWHDKEKIQGYMNDLKELGHEITHDWTTYESDPNNSFQDMADRDIDGVMNADVLVVIMDDDKYPYRATFTELGVAYATKKMRQDYKIFILCPSWPHVDEKDRPYYSTNCFFRASGIDVYASEWKHILRLLKLKK